MNNRFGNMRVGKTYHLFLDAKSVDEDVSKLVRNALELQIKGVGKYGVEATDVYVRYSVKDFMEAQNE